MHFLLNSLSPVDDFEFRTEQFLPVSTLSFKPKLLQLSLDWQAETSENDSVVCPISRLQLPVLQYLESIFGLLFQLLQQVTECDTKMQVLHVISCVIERVNIQVRPGMHVPESACLVIFFCFFLPSIPSKSEVVFFFFFKSNFLKATLALMSVLLSSGVFFFFFNPRMHSTTTVWSYGFFFCTGFSISHSNPLSQTLGRGGGGQLTFSSTCSRVFSELSAHLSIKCSFWLSLSYKWLLFLWCVTLVKSSPVSGHK